MKQILHSTSGYVQDDKIGKALRASEQAHPSFAGMGHPFCEVFG